MRNIELTRKSKGVSNWFTDEWVTNGHFAVSRDIVENSDRNLEELGFEERDGEELTGRLRLIPETFDSGAIFDSGFKFRNLTLFFGKNNELVCFETQYIRSLGVVRAEYSEVNQVAKVYNNGAVSMILKPMAMKNSDIEKFFPNYKILV
jgi:hypothetical protein